MVNKRNKWSLSLGCIGRDACYTLVSLFMLVYIQYTGLVNTAQFAVLTIIIVLCRIWDAVNDPMMGTIITNTKTRFGKFRPWVLIGCLTNAVVLVLMFTVRFGEQSWANVAFLGTMYLLWGMTFTMNDISYWDLLPALTNEKKERDSLTTLVAVFASLGAFAAGGVIPMVTSGNMIVAYRWISIVCASLFVICQLVVFFFVHDNPDDSFIEKKHPELEAQEAKQEKITLRGMVKILVGNKQLLVMAVVILLYSLGSSILNAFGQNFFYFKYSYLAGGDYMFYFTIVYAVGTLISQAVYPFFANKFKRAQLMNFSIIMLVLGYLAFFLVANLMSGAVGFILLSVLGVLIFVGQGIFYCTMLIMLTNTIEYGELLTGRNDSAIVFTIRPFMVKLASALEYGVVALTLIVCGLTKITDASGAIEVTIGMIKGGTEPFGEAFTGQTVIDFLNTNYGVAPTAITSVSGLSDFASLTDSASIIAGLQAYENSIFHATAGSVWGLTAVMTILPIVCFIVAWVVQKKKYIISEEKYEEILKELEAKKSEASKVAE